MVGSAGGNQGGAPRGYGYPAPATGEGGGAIHPDGVPLDGHYEDVDVAIVMESTYPVPEGRG